MEFGEELKTFIQVWFLAILATCYCYLIPNRIISKLPRLLSVLPVIIIFSIVPIPLSTIYFTLITFLYLTWLANFKLLLYAFNRDPLAFTPPLPFFKFVSIALFPINYKETSAPLQLKSHRTNQSCLELAYAITALFVKIFTGFKFEIEPQFNEPYLATSLQDFWGRRWNLVVSSILRPIVYNPIREVMILVIGKLWSQMYAIFMTFMLLKWQSRRRLMVGSDYTGRCQGRLRWRL
ncbi:long-chain-alcohol O-fatty-acyltransferase [Artemisia annua]|uniref:Long-chain-alcohol O-fatty-acyltransferase n=1 Tax=Artemisia annua TaxID=35608 RepID=A0A2U1LGJ3_ARTAN|nr:long-chain-alcohol O-fatty-acyltransferase [Artemisia annua]